MLRIFNSIIASFRLVSAVAVMGLYYIYFRILRPFKKDKLAWGLRVQQQYTTICMFLLGTKHSMEGELYDGPALYVSNHRSLLDPVIVRQYITAMGVAKAEISKYPVMGKAVQETGIVFVNRTDKTSRASAKDAIVEQLKQGNSIILFPEGTVSGETTTLPFRRGSFDKAVEAQVPAIPITLIYNHPRFYWHNMSTMTYFFGSFGWTTPNVHMVVGQPIHSTDSTEAMNLAQATINKNLLRLTPSN